MTTPSFKSEEVVKLRLGIELAQPYDAFKPFYKTTSGSTAETVVTVSEFMTEANYITLVADKADLYVNFNGDATTDVSSCRDWIYGRFYSSYRKDFNYKGR